MTTHERTEAADARSRCLTDVPLDQPWARLGGVWLTAVAPAGFTVSLSLATSNTMGSTKKTVSNASTFLGFALGSTSWI